MLVLDHALWGGRVADPSDRDADTLGLRDASAAIAADSDWIPALLTVGDGVLVALLQSR
jgi:predicted O-methyltransferase YrrM